LPLSPGSRLGPYEVVAPLGAGGMGEVYRAKDPRLGRDVAIKVLPASFSNDPDRLKRFEQEARAAGLLNHPNITGVYDIGQHDGAPYVVQELLEGETLRMELAGGRFAARKAIDYATQIAHGLSAAHEKGIVHRDLKPENLFVTKDGRVKILDFGLAKLTQVESTGGATNLPTATGGTEPGVVMGTLGYMSPEQIKGKPANPRSDIFAFGAILYEMLSGKRAFHADSAGETMAAILKEDPPDLSVTNQNISPGLERIVRHCLEKNPESRFHSAHDLAFDLEALSEVVRPVSVPHPARTMRPAWLIAGAAVLAALLVAALLLRPRSGTIESLAVLPFVNAGADPGAEYLSDGITESLINSLSQLPNLTVMSRNSVFRYKGRETDAQAAGKELKVQAVLTGRVVQRGGELVVSAELVDTRNNSHIWGDQYSRKLSDILAVQEEITRDISTKLRRRLTSEEKVRLSKRYTENTEAYGLYLKGRYHWNKRTPGDIQKGIEYFQQAIEKDPTYALAFSGLAESYDLLSQYTGLPSSETFPRAKAAASKALEIDETLAPAHAALAYAHEFFDWDFSSAEKEYRRAIELDPKYPTAHHWYSLYLSCLGRHEEAIREAEHAYELDPLSLIINNLRGYTFYCSRQYEAAIEAERKALELDRSFPRFHLTLGAALEQKKLFPEAVAELEEAARLSGRRIEALGELANGYAASGRREEAIRLIEELKRWSERGYDPLANIALVYAGLGQNDEAMQWLEKAYKARSGWLILLALKVDPRWDGLRTDPRFQDLLRRIGLPS
jgi:serine/threonine protein kinase/tetratricopeptide (TPR) repeat protein